jgi:translation initiation factor 5A
MASWIDAYNVKVGSTISIDGVACSVKGIDVSKSGKHGASKCRIEAVGIADDKKRIVAVPGSERFEVPMIEKRRAQVLSFDKLKGTASVMDLESFETIEVKVSEDILKDLEENRNVEYWDVDGKKIVKRLA